MNDEDKSASADAAPESETGKNGAPGDDVAGELSIEEQLAEVGRKAEAFRDQMLRARAELENTRKRTDKEIQRARKYALEPFALELLDIKDNLERGLSDDMSAGAPENVGEGMRLTLKSLERVFDKFGIEEVSPAGEAFDPKLHQAMTVFETDEYAPNTVIEVSQKGYLLSDRLLRPAMVVVSAKPAGDEPDAARDEPADEDEKAGETP